jgi:hypothetical protein
MHLAQETDKGNSNRKLTDSAEKEAILTLTWGHISSVDRPTRSSSSWSIGKLIAVLVFPTANYKREPENFIKAFVYILTHMPLYLISFSEFHGLGYKYPKINLVARSIIV